MKLRVSPAEAGNALSATTFSYQRVQDRGKGVKNLIVGVLVVSALLIGFKFYQKEQKRQALVQIEQQKRREEQLRQQIRAQQRQFFAEDEATVGALLSEWRDQFQVATSAPRISLPTLVPPLQALLRRLEGMQFKSTCLAGSAKKQLEIALQLQINGLLAFLGEHSYTAAESISAGTEAVDDFNTMRDKCRAQLATS